MLLPPAPPPLFLRCHYRGKKQHVPVETYKANLLSMVQQLKGAGVLHVVIMTPPPVNEGASPTTTKVG